MMAVWGPLGNSLYINLIPTLGGWAFSPPHLQVRKPKTQRGSDLPMATQMGRRLLFLTLSQATFPWLISSCGKPRKAKSILPPVKLETQPGFSWSKLPIWDRTRRHHGLVPCLSGWLWSPCLTAGGPGHGNLALGPDHPPLRPRAGRVGWAEGRAGPRPLSVFTFWTFIVSLSLKWKNIP